MPPERICEVCGHIQYAMYGDKCYECGWEFRTYVSWGYPESIKPAERFISRLKTGIIKSTYRGDGN